MTCKIEDWKSTSVGKATAPSSASDKSLEAYLPRGQYDTYALIRVLVPATTDHIRLIPVAGWADEMKWVMPLMEFKVGSPDADGDCPLVADIYDLAKSVKFGDGFTLEEWRITKDKDKPNILVGDLTFVNSKGRATASWRWID